MRMRQSGCRERCGLICGRNSSPPPPPLSALPKSRSRRSNGSDLQDYRGDLERIVNAGFSLQQRLNEALKTAIPDDIDAYRAQLRHDLRTPINAVKGYGEMIVEDAMDSGHEAIVSDLRKLLDAAERHADPNRCVGRFYRAGDRRRAGCAGRRASVAARVIEAIRGVERNAVLSDIAGRILVIDDNEFQSRPAGAEARARRPRRQAASGGAEALLAFGGSGIRPHPARYPDAGYERLRGSGAIESGPAHAGNSGHHDFRAR